MNKICTFIMLYHSKDTLDCSSTDIVLFIIPVGIEGGSLKSAIFGEFTELKS